MKMNKRISIIGLRAFPSDFVGTSGVEAYVQKIIQSNSLKKYPFRVFVKSCYQKKNSQKLINNVELKVTFTFVSKIFESVIYGLFSSIYCFFDDSTTVWYQGLGMATWSWIPYLRGKRILITIHSLDWERKKWSFFQNLVFKTISLLILKRNYYQLVVVSSKLRDFLAEKYLQQNIKIIKPGFNNFSLKTKYQSKNQLLSKKKLLQEKYLLFLGRFVPEKNIEGLVNEFNDLNNDNNKKNLKLVLAGGSSNMENFEKKIVQLITNNPAIIRLKYVFGKEKLELIKNCYAVVLPSFLEGNPIVLYETVGLDKKCIVNQNWIDQEFNDNDLVYKVNIYKKHWLRRALRAINDSNNSQTIYKKSINTYRSWNDSAKAYLQMFGL